MKSPSSHNYPYLNIGGLSVENWRKDYQKSSMGVLQANGFLDAKIATAISTFLTHDAQYQTVYGLRNSDGHVVDHEEFEKASESDRFFFYDQQRNSGDAGLNSGLITFIRLKSFLSSESFFELVREITGLPILSATNTNVHRLKYGHYLRPHNDRDGARRIAYIIYLTPDWREEYGGQLCVTSHSDQTECFVPNYNSLILFDVERHKEHRIEDLTLKAADKARLSIGGWLNV